LQQGDFLAALPAAGLEPPPEHAGPAAGDHIGPWLLIHELGQGGMGSVWLAERADGGLKRRVALKLPRLSWVRGLAYRMARERDILAALDHPRIGRLHDAGVDAQGRPWLALEYVQGQPVDVFCRERGLSVRDRVALLLQVCEAVAYAHSRLVIHRDLKPSNILVTDEGEVRLLDFGIAKLVQEAVPRPGEPALTELAGVALTVGYASPEQLREEALTTASDVFSLGVVAYELLTGRLPWRAEGRSVMAYERALAEGPAPLASRVAAEPAAAAALRGDLDAMLDRALQPELVARYAGADDFGADLRAWLAGEPVSARRRAPTETMRHWVRRHKPAVAAGALVLLTLAAATAVSTWQALRAREEAAIAAAEAERARKEAARAVATQALLNRIFQLNTVDQPDPQRAQRTTVRELLDLAARSAGEVMKDTPEAHAEMLGTLSGLYSQLGMNTLATRTARERAEVARRALAEDDPRRADAFLSLASRLHDTPERARAAVLIDEAEQVMRRAGPAAESLQGALALQRARHERWGRIEAGLAHAERAVAWYRQHQPESQLRSSALYFASTLADLAGDPARGLEHLAESRQIAEARVGPSNRALLTAVAERGDLLVRHGRWAEADAAHAEAEAVALRLLGADNSSTLVMAIHRARYLVDTGRVQQGEQLWADVQRRIAERQPPLESWWIDYARSLMSRLGMERGRPDLLEPEVRAGVLRALETVPDSVVVVNRRLLLADVLLALGRLDEAEAELAQAAAVWQRAGAGLAPANPVDEALQRLRAMLLLARGDAPGTLAMLNGARRNRALAPLAPDRGEVRRQLLRSAASLQLGQPEAALAAARAARAELQRLQPPLRWPGQEADTWLAQGQALRALGQHREADAALAQAVAERRAFDLPGSLWLAQAEAARAEGLRAGAARRLDPAR
jgi:serine/threonine-protein kinase